MGLRPWNVFKKTLYISHAKGAAAAVPLTTKLSLARAKVQSEELGGQGASYGERLALLLPVSFGTWLLLLATWWRYGDAERLRALERRPGGAVLLDLLGWRAVAHLGPFQVPNFVRARLHEEPLRLLREPLLLDHERVRALSRLEQLTQRRHAVARLPPPAEASSGVYCSNALQGIEPLLAEAFAAPLDAFGKATDGQSASQKAAVVRIILDVVAATAPEERAVPAWVLSGLVSARGDPWDAGPQGEELRITLLCQLLRTPANCEAAASVPLVVSFLQQAGMKRKEDTVWPLKAYLLSGETPDLLRRGARLVARQCPGTLEVPARYKRDTPSLETKRDLRNAWTTVLITSGWAAFRAWRGVLDVPAVFAMARASACALAGMGVLEGLWRAEEHVIQSVQYYEDTRVMLPASAGMCLLRCAVWAWAFRYSTAVPFAFCRLVKDDFLDAYRSFEV
mmetsp:Transcript_40496/g.81659  ORF Transcript_40496/g.81659 Transcript_40496/m.81659 type:complete len:453 (-) Transcript_40496:102-1460(-)